jgi:hypothetical protein
MMGRMRIGVSTLALGIALASSTNSYAAMRRSAVTAQIADYNAGQVAATGGSVTVPAGLAFYSVQGDGRSLEINSRLTVTLPAGFSFASQPSLFASGEPPMTSLVLVAGGVGAQTASFAIEGVPLTEDQSATLDSYAVQGATALETPVPPQAALPIAFQATNNAEIANNDRAPISAAAFASEPGLAVSAAGLNDFIDLTTPSLGTLFEAPRLAMFAVGVPDHRPDALFAAADTTTVAIIDLELLPEALLGTTLFPPDDTIAVLSPDGNPNSFGTSGTASVTVAGAFNGIGAAFAASDPFCTTPIAQGSATPTGITIPNAIPNAALQSGTDVFICITSAATTLLQESPDGWSVTLTPSSDPDFLAITVPTGTASSPSVATPRQSGFLLYDGGGVLGVTNFFTGDDAGYASLVRVNNASSTPATLFALVQPDSGGPMLSGPLGALGAGMGTVFTEAEIQAVVPGLDLANSGQRATLQLVVAGPTQQDQLQSSPAAAASGVLRPAAPVFAERLGGLVTATGLLLNPSGAVTAMPFGQDGAPVLAAPN